MTPEEKDRFLAEKLMGWHDYLLDYFDQTDSIGVIKIPNPKYKDWHPSKDITQVLGDGGPGTVVGEMRKLGFYLNLVNGTEVYTAWFARYKEPKIKRTIGYFERVGETVRNEIPAAAITDAAVRVLMEEGK